MSKAPDTPLGTLKVAFLVCLVCSVVVSSAAVFLGQVQDENRLLDRQRSILTVAGYAENRMSRTQIRDLFVNNIHPRLVNLETGKFSNDFDPTKFLPLDAANDDELSIELSREQDTAGIRRRERYSVVYVVNNDAGQLQTLVLPIRGPGAWGPISGLISLNADMTTAKNIIFYQHSETPGLGGEIDNPRWRALWSGLSLFNDQGRLAVEIVQQRDPNSPQAIHQVDALAGATVTSNFVDRMVKFWLGDDAFGPFIQNLRKGEA